MVVTFIATIQFDLQITCPGKTRVNGGRQKAKAARVLMNPSRLRQLGPQQFTKKAEEGWQDEPFF